MIWRLMGTEVLVAVVFGALLLVGILGADPRRGKYNGFDRLGLFSLTVLFFDFWAVVGTAFWAVWRA